MAQNATNILMAGAKVFYAPTGEALPDENSIAYDVDWGANWNEVGFTSAPVAMSTSREVHSIKAQQRIGTLKERQTDEEIMVETTLAEFTSDNLQLVMGGTASTTVPAPAQVGKDELVAGGKAILDERAWGFEGMYKDSSNVLHPVRFFFYICTSIINGNLEFAKENESGIPLQIRVLVDTSKAKGADKFKFQRVTAPNTS